MMNKNNIFFTFFLVSNLISSDRNMVFPKFSPRIVPIENNFTVILPGGARFLVRPSIVYQIKNRQDQLLEEFKIVYIDCPQECFEPLISLLRCTTELEIKTAIKHFYSSEDSLFTVSNLCNFVKKLPSLVDHLNIEMDEKIYKLIASEMDRKALQLDLDLAEKYWRDPLKREEIEKHIFFCTESSLSCYFIKKAS